MSISFNSIPIKLQYEKSTCSCGNFSGMLSPLLSIKELHLLRSSEKAVNGMNKKSAIIVILYRWYLSNVKINSLRKFISHTL